VTRKFELELVIKTGLQMLPTTGNSVNGIKTEPEAQKPGKTFRQCQTQTRMNHPDGAIVQRFPVLKESVLENRVQTND